MSLCVYNEETLNTFKTTTDFDERVATLSNMCVSTLRINIENKNYWKESNNIVELLIGTDNILAHGVNTYIAYKDVFYSDYSQHWKKDNYQYKNEDNTLKSGKYIVIVQNYSDLFSMWGCQNIAVSNVFEVTDNTEGIYDIFNSSAVQCTKTMRNGQIYIQRGDKVYTIQGREVK